MATEGRTPDSLSERRLLELRALAREKRIEKAGVRALGAPFPAATPEVGYYGLPALKEPQWTWEIPLYFFIGGAAGASAVIAAVAEYSGSHAGLAKDARRAAAVGAMVSAPLLIADLGRPERFLNMLRVFKPQSAMSMGAWTLFVFSNSAIVNAAMDLLDGVLPRFLRKLISAAATPVAALSGTVMSSYTGVLIGATCVPVWNQNIKTLPVHFAMSGVNSATAVLELAGNDAPALNLLGMGAAAFETLEGAVLERRHEPADEPLKHGRSGMIVRAGGLLSGPIPFILRAAALFAGKEDSRKLRRAAAACSLAGSLLTRVGWLQAGKVSARDNRLPLQLDPPAQPASPALTYSE